MDDSITIIEAPSKYQLKDRVKFFSKEYERWANSNELAISTEKTEIMTHFKSKPIEEYTICGFNVKSKKVIKVLGIYLSYNLRWNKHAETVNDELRSLINVLRKVEEVIPSYLMLKQFSHAIILSKIRYGLSLWGSLFPIPGMLQDKKNKTGNKQSLLKIECSLNHVARIMINFKGNYQDMPIETLYEKANISSLS